MLTKVKKHAWTIVLIVLLALGLIFPVVSLVLSILITVTVAVLVVSFVYIVSSDARTEKATEIIKILRNKS